MKQKSKIDPRMVLDAFISGNSRKSNFGNFRVEDDQIVYRAQSSVEAKWNKHDKTFDEWRKETGTMIGEYDGKLVDCNGKMVLLEAMTPNTEGHPMRVQYYKTNLVAVKIKDQMNNPVYIGNISTLELVGRTVAYGNVSENDKETEIQKEMKKDRRFIMLPLETLEADGVDVSKIEIVSRGAIEMVRVKEKTNDIHITARSRATVHGNGFQD